MASRGAGGNGRGALIVNIKPTTVPKPKMDSHVAAETLSAKCHPSVRHQTVARATQTPAAKGRTAPIRGRRSAIQGTDAGVSPAAFMTPELSHPCADLPRV
jgi:hypothetical protein